MHSPLRLNEHLLFLDESKFDYLIENGDGIRMEPLKDEFSLNQKDCFFIPEGHYPLLISKSFAEKIIIRKDEDSSSESKGLSKKDDIDKIPRPANAFILYRKDKHKEISNTNKMVDNKKISQIIGRMWKHEGFEIKQKYLEMAEAEKSMHKTKYPNYKYKPRQNIKKRNKPSPKPYSTTQNIELYDTLDINLEPIFK